MLLTYGRHLLAAVLVVVGVASCSSDKHPTAVPGTTVVSSSPATFHGEASWRKGKIGLVGSYTVKYQPDRLVSLRQLALKRSNRWASAISVPAWGSEMPPSTTRVWPVT